MEPRAILYTDTIDGKEVHVDNLWAITTDEWKEFDHLRAEVERLTSSRDQWKDACLDSNAMVYSHSENIKLLRVALRPFAMHACGCGECFNCVGEKAMSATDKD